MPGEGEGAERAQDGVNRPDFESLLNHFVILNFSF